MKGGVKRGGPQKPDDGDVEISECGSELFTRLNDSVFL
jgi:hypothetical protein